MGGPPVPRTPESGCYAPARAANRLRGCVRVVLNEIWLESVTAYIIGVFCEEKSFAVERPLHVSLVFFCEEKSVQECDTESPPFFFTD